MHSERDYYIVELIAQGRLRVDAEAGLVYAPKSNTPDKPVGSLTAHGYLRICMNTGPGVREFFFVHRVVWVSVHGPVAHGHSVDHVNTQKTDNRIANLESVTKLENMARAKRAGLCADNGRRDTLRDAGGRFGKKTAGHLLDGKEWHQFPERK